MLNRCARAGVLVAAIFSPLVLAQDKTAQPTTQPSSKPPAQAPVPTPAESAVARTQRQAAALESLVTSDLAHSFLAATAKLPDPGERTLYRNRAKGVTLAKPAFDALPADQQAGYEPRPCTPDFYYDTKHGSALVYSRVVDLIAKHATFGAGDTPRLLDFGYGTIGQLRLLAECGFDAHGVDIDPDLAALYSDPADTGAAGSGGTGRVGVHLGRWPAEPALVAAIGRNFDVITSKNTLKAGYIHPTPPAGQTVDPRKLVKLGVDDTTFLKSVHDSLKPAGLFVIYNICPAQNPPDKEYIPWADGKSPWSREEFAAAGFDVLEFDVEDQAWVLDCFARLGYLGDKPREQSAKEYFCWYTVLKRKD